MILGSQGVKPDMRFTCCDCDDTFTGQDVIDRNVDLHIVAVNKADPQKSTFRCELCQEDVDEREGW